MEQIIPTSKSAQLCSPQVTFMRECEAREWIQRYRDKTNQVGASMAQHWWEVTKAHIARIRGQAGLDTLIAEMYRQRNETRSKG